MQIISNKSKELIEKKTFSAISSVILAILLCAFFIVIKNVFSPFFLKYSTYGMPALIQKGEITNLYVGSSMFRQGLDIDELENGNNNESNYILAYNGNQPVFEYIQLRNLLENNVTIKNLYIDMYVYSIIEPPDLDDEKMLLELPLSVQAHLIPVLKA